MLSQSVWSRLSYRLDSVGVILAGASEDAITARAPVGGWSAHDHLAHLARMHEVLLDHLRRILREEDPQLPDYRPEDDPEWPHWVARGTREVVTRHPVLGPLAVSAWLESFCLYEARHLHLAWVRVAATQRGLPHDHHPLVGE